MYLPSFLFVGDFSIFFLMVNIGDCDSDSQSESKLPTEMSEIRHMVDIVKSNTHKVHSSVTPSAAQQLNCRLH